MTQIKKHIHAAILLSLLTVGIFPHQAFAGLIDSLSGATFAFSLSRYLKTSFEGSTVVRLRENNTNSTLDFKLNGSGTLVSNDVNEQTVSAWLTANSATTAYVVFLYDHSGNGRTMGTTTTTYQPILRVNSNLNNLAAIDFSGNAEARLVGNWSITSSNGIEIHSIASPEGTIATGERMLFSNSATSLAYAGVNSTNGWFWQADFGEELASNVAAVSGNDYQLSYRYPAADTFTIDVNCAEVLNQVNPGGPIDWRTGDQVLGSSGYTVTDRPFGGLIAELIFYNGVYASDDIDDIQTSMGAQAGVSTCGPQPPTGPLYFSVGKLLVTGGKLIII